MKEAFLAYVWKYQLFDQKDLQTLQGESFNIIATGVENEHDGPDFFNAQIKIGTTTWAGNVEIHIHTSDWYKHQHQTDKAYSNIILHVVYEQDIPSTDELTTIPTLVLKNRILPKVYKNYLQLLGKFQWIPCEKLLPKVDIWTMYNWLDRLLIERIEQKTIPLLQSLQANQYSWETTCYEYIAKGFGAKVNALPFELLAKSLPLQIVAKHKASIFQVEALLFGQAGFLHENHQEEYPKKLYQEYVFLKQKFSLQPLNVIIWKFARLRPPNFPTVRIAQFASLIHQSSNLFSKVIETPTLKNYYQLFQADVSAYWDTHYTFDKLSKVKRRKRLGKMGIDTLIINTLVPLLFVYSQERGEETLKQTALALLQELDIEKNSLLDKWKKVGVVAKTAADGQALLQLKNEYCTAQKCLRCAIGYKLINNMS